MNRLPTLTHPLKVNHWFTKPIGDRIPRLITPAFACTFFELLSNCPPEPHTSHDAKIPAHEGCTDDIDRVHRVAARGRSYCQRHRGTGGDAIPKFEDTLTWGEICDGLLARTEFNTRATRWRTQGSLTRWALPEPGHPMEMTEAFEIRRLEDRVRDFERLLGHKTLDVEIFKKGS